MTRLHTYALEGGDGLVQPELLWTRFFITDGTTLECRAVFFEAFEEEMCGVSLSLFTVAMVWISPTMTAAL